MNFIKINLNQTVSKAQRDFLLEEKKRWYYFAAICSMFLASFIWLFIINNLWEIGLQLQREKIVGLFPIIKSNMGDYLVLFKIRAVNRAVCLTRGVLPLGIRIVMRIGMGCCR